MCFGTLCAFKGFALLCWGLALPAACWPQVADFLILLVEAGVMATWLTKQVIWAVGSKLDAAFFGMPVAGEAQQQPQAPERSVDVVAGGAQDHTNNRPASTKELVPISQNKDERKSRRCLANAMCNGASSLEYHDAWGTLVPSCPLLF